MAVPLVVLSVFAAPPDPLGCDAMLFDPDDTLDRDQVEPAIERVGSRLGADVRVRVERTLDEFRDGRFTEGVVDGLEELTSPVPEMSVGLPAAGNDGGGTRSPTAFVVVFVLVLAVIAAINVARYLKTGEWGAASSTGHRNRSFSSFGSFGSSGGSGSSSSPGSSGSGRAGGGSKRW
jgi:hypothetical protein